NRPATFVFGIGAHAPQVAFDHAGREAAPAPAHAVADRFGKPHHLDGARPVGQAANEAALFKRGDEAVNAGFGAQVESVLHLVEGRRHARLLQALMDKSQQFQLLPGEHRVSPARWSGPSRLVETNHEHTLYVPYVFHNPLIWGEEVE